MLYRLYCKIGRIELLGCAPQIFGNNSVFHYPREPIMTGGIACGVYQCHGPGSRFGTPVSTFHGDRSIRRSYYELH